MNIRLTSHCINSEVLGSFQRTEVAELTPKLLLFLQEAYSLWLTADQGWSTALDVIPSLLFVFGRDQWEKPDIGPALLNLLSRTAGFNRIRYDLLARLYRRMHDLGGYSTATVLFQLASTHDSADKTSHLPKPALPASIGSEGTDLYDLAVVEAMRFGDLALADNLLRSSIQKAEQASNL